MLALLLTVAKDAAQSTGTDSTVLVLIACGFAALMVLINNQNKAAPQVIAAPAPAAPSADVLALQETVRLMVDSQRQQAAQPRFRPAATSSAAVRPSTESPEIENSQAHSSFLAAMSDSTGVPFELLDDMRRLQESVKNLERKNRELNRELTLTQVSNVVDVEKKYRLPIPVVNDDGSLGTQSLNLSASEIETIRAIFNMFDADHSGYVHSQHLQALHKQLGEPLTDEEANDAVHELDQEGTGKFNFNKFLVWWYQSHQDQQGKKGAYKQRFKLMHAKLTASNFDFDKVITQNSGDIYTLEYRLNFYYKGHNQALRQISPWHDIPLNRIGSGEQGQLFNFVCEIPKWTRAKFECATNEQYNPIKQDTQHGQLRYYKHGDMMFNYGYFPQTWEDPEHSPDDTGYPGDNDPIDCVEIGAAQMRVGGISAVKVLGVLGLIDDGETDWKVIAINISDPMAHLLNDVDDVEVHLPGAIKAIREYFRDYKSFSGKINKYALKAQAMPRSYAVKVIEETHQHWKSLHLIKSIHTIGESAQQADSRKVEPAKVAAPTSSPKLTGAEQPLDKLMDGQ